MISKLCTRCLNILALIEFSPNKSYNDGYSYWCKGCSNNYRKSRPITKKRTYSKEVNKKSYLKHKHKRLIEFKDYYLNNKEKIKKKQKEYRQQNKEFINLRNRKRKKMISGKNISSKDLIKLKKDSGNICKYCGSSINLQIDHYIPLSKGGKHEISNLVIACRSCNCSKKDIMPEDWIRIKNKL